jgi:hypothetical protein
MDDEKAVSSLMMH